MVAIRAIAVGDELLQVRMRLAQRAHLPRLLLFLFLNGVATPRACHQDYRNIARVEWLEEMLATVERQSARQLGERLAAATNCD